MLIAVVLGAWVVASVPAALVAGRLMQVSSCAEVPGHTLDPGAPFFGADARPPRLADAGAFLA